jgi:hypothetical protein
MTVFTFGDTIIHTFDQHKTEFANKYNGGRHMNYNLAKNIDDSCNNPNFFEKLGKTVDFHEDIIKQMYLIIEQQNTEMGTMKKRMEEYEIYITTKLFENKKVKEQEEQQDKKNRYVALKKELRELENDLKFHKKDN